MRPLSVFIFVFALLMAGLVYFVMPRLMNRPVEAQLAPQPARMAAADVLVAARPLPAGTILKAGDVRWQRWPDEGIDPNFLLRDKGATPEQDAVGRVVLRGLTAGEPVTATRLIKSGEAGFLAAALEPGMRAVSVKIDAVSGDGGFIVPGDRVDVLLAERFPITYANNGDSTHTRPSHKTVNSVVLSDVRVLAIDQEMRDLDNKPKIGQTATLEVELAQAQKLALAPQIGTLSLALRSLARPELAEPRAGTIQDTDVSPFLSKLIRQPTETGIRVYRGGAVAGH
jgi:pilus assembly protein CpaB